MLFTRCPDCLTTFRITVETLHQADGRVRCGLCAGVFNAFEHLRDSVTDAERALAARRGHIPATQTTPVTDFATSDAGSTDATASESSPEPEDITPETPVPDEPQAPAITDQEVEEVLEREAEETVMREPWTADLDPPTQRPSGQRRWKLAAGLAAAALGLQAIHYFRADLAASAVVGPLIERAYAAVGAPIEYPFNLNQYDIIEWTAAAEETESGADALRVVASFRNLGPDPQPYPYFFLRLTDRWDAEIGSRAFRPAEYLTDEIPADAMMRPGDNMRAELTLVDPGPTAYGFEVDVCLAAGDDRLRCKGDLLTNR
jgi:predicted Zn finger-like uncharacterized protein